MNGQEKQNSLALYVSIIVIIGLAIVFIIIFILYSIKKGKHISCGNEDEILKLDIDKKISSLEEKAANKGEKIDKANIKSILLEKKVSDRVFEILMYIFSFVIFGVLIVTFSFALSFKLNNQNLYIFDTTYLAIRTGSMETVNESNTYIQENNLTNQIETYSLIGIDKVSSDEEIELYDILAYKYKGTTYVHRVIKIFTDEETGTTCYTLRGDANSSSLSFETKITLDDIVGKYNGYQNYGLGVAFFYLQSNIGIVAIVSAMLFVTTFDFSEGKIEKAYYKRSEYILEQIEEKAKNEKNPEIEGKEDQSEETILEDHKEQDNGEIKGSNASLIKKIKRVTMTRKMTKLFTILYAFIVVVTLVGTGFCSWRFIEKGVKEKKIQVVVTDEASVGYFFIDQQPLYVLLSEVTYSSADLFD